MKLSYILKFRFSSEYLTEQLYRSKTTEAHATIIQLITLYCSLKYFFLYVNYLLLCYSRMEMDFGSVETDFHICNSVFIIFMIYYS